MGWYLKKSFANLPRGTLPKTSLNRRRAGPRVQWDGNLGTSCFEGFLVAY